MSELSPRVSLVTSVILNLQYVVCESALQMQQIQLDPVFIPLIIIMKFNHKGSKQLRSTFAEMTNKLTNVYFIM